MTDTLTQMFQKKPFNNDLKEQQDYLNLRSLYPKTYMSDDLDSRVGGAYRPGAHEIRINPNFHLGPEYLKQNYQHELQHAVDAVIEDQYVKTKKKGRWSTPTKIEQQFMEGFDKLNSPYPTKVKDGYRDAVDEQRAYGVGDSNTQLPSIYPTDQHINATMATEAAIMRDLATRSANGTNPPTWYDKHVDIIKNLFK